MVTAAQPTAKTEDKTKPIVNDFSVQAATVNGTGSQSANNIFAKTIFRMGIPVGPKNMFPSNIAGLPTWFTVRLSKHGFTARKRNIDILVAMNEQTWAQDVKNLRPGGVLIDNNEMFVAKRGPGRNDIIHYPIPFTTLAREKLDSPKLRKLLTNMIYVGVLAEMLGLDREILKTAVQDNFQGKEKAIAINLKAIEVGAEYFRNTFKKIDPFYTEKMQATQGKILMDGNTACALGALMGGCTVVAWYPITPSSSLCETFIALCEQYRKDAQGRAKYADVQAEDELASAGMVLGASWMGARAMTATAGPGISLMSEFVGLGYYAEVPGVFFDIQRVGPSTGLPTRTGQQDILTVYFLSHGDTKHICLIPGNITEAYEFSQKAFDFADRFQTPIFVLSDLDLGMNMWMTDPLPYPKENFDRGKVLTAAELEKLKTFERYRDVDGDGICYRTLPGTKHPKAPFFTRGSGHNEAAAYTEDGEAYVRNIQRLAKKFATARKVLPQPIMQEDKTAKIAIVAYGTSDEAAHEAIVTLQTVHKLSVSYLRLRALPIAEEVNEFIKRYQRVYVVDQNRDAQLKSLLTLEAGEEGKRLRSVLHFDGLPLDAETIVQQVIEQEKTNQ